MSKLCEFCGTPVDESDYQDDGYRHTDGRCTEYLKAALGAANREAAGLREQLAAAEHKLVQVRTVFENYDDNWQDVSAWTAMAAIGEVVKP